MTDLLLEQAGDDGQILVFVCATENEHLNFSTALHLFKDLQKATPMTEVRGLVWLFSSAGLATLLEKERSEGSLARALDGFGMIAQSCNLDLMKNESLDVRARWLHERYLETLDEAGTDRATKPAGKSWDDLDERFRDSNRLQADHVAVKLRTFGDIDPGEPEFSDEQVTLLAVLEHQRWMASQMLEDCGKSREALMVDWDNLSEEERQKDINPITVIRELVKVDPFV